MPVFIDQPTRERPRLSALAAFSSAVVAGACTGIACGPSVPEPAAPLTPPIRLCAEPEPSAPCRSADEVQTWLSDPSLEIRGGADTPGGIQGAKVLTLALPRPGGDVVFRAKWRALSTTTAYNDPRKELAAHAVQKFYLEPYEYVVPPAAGHCFELEHYRRRVDARAEPSFVQMRCVFGILSYWLEEASSIDDAADEDWIDTDQGFFDPVLFRKDPIYRRSAAHVNLLTYLIDHDDSHSDQFLIARGSVGLRVYSVDNSMSFGAPRNPDLDKEDDWSRLHVPALPRRDAERLLQLGRTDLEALHVIEQYEVLKGVLVPARPGGAGDNDAGLRWVRPGERAQLQIGLTRAEVRQLGIRLDALRRRVERGNIELF